MFKVLAILLIAVGLCLCQAKTTNKAKTDSHLMQFMLKSQQLSQENPGRSINCFGVYLPKLNNIADQYEEDYGKCISVAESQRRQVDNKTQPKRNELEHDAAVACSNLAKCQDRDDSVSYFTCFSDAGSDNSKAMYRISANATDALSVVQEDYRLIGIKQTNCTNVAERHYVENTSSTYEALNLCLAGNLATAVKITGAEGIVVN